MVTICLRGEASAVYLTLAPTKLDDVFWLLLCVANRLGTNSELFAYDAYDWDVIWNNDYEYDIMGIV